MGTVQHKIRKIKQLSLKKFIDILPIPKYSPSSKDKNSSSRLIHLLKCVLALDNNSLTLV